MSFRGSLAFTTPTSLVPFTTRLAHRRLHHQFAPPTLLTPRNKPPRTFHTVPTSALKPTSPRSKQKPKQNPDARRITPEEQAPPQPKFLRRASKGALSNVSQTKPLINWYPGHIAKAERTLKQSIKLVDVVIEVRDSRIPIATAHPNVPDWLSTRTHLLVLNRADLASEAARSAWRAHFESTGQPVRFVNARQGRGVKELKKVAIEAGASVNAKRKQRGLLPRPVRCLVIGYPNVGKSALINKLVGRNTAKSANKPGVTRNYQWIRISNDIELLDMPGIIPAKFISQDQALRLAICDDIGQAAYDSQIIAALMLEELKRVVTLSPGFFDFSIIRDRFGGDPMLQSGEEYLTDAAHRVCKGDVERAAVRLLTEFRAGILGRAALETPDMLTANANVAQQDTSVTD